MTKHKLVACFSEMSYRFVDSFRAGARSCSCSKAVYKPVWHIQLLSVQWINSWWWTEELSETRRVSWQNKFVKLVHLLGFIIKKFVTMHGHTNVKSSRLCSLSMTRAQEVHSKQILVQPLQYFSLSVRLHSTRLGSWARDFRKVMKLNLTFLSLESIVILWILW